jgi:hypothetical protein
MSTVRTEQKWNRYLSEGPLYPLTWDGGIAGLSYKEGYFVLLLKQKGDGWGVGLEGSQPTLCPGK